MKQLIFTILLIAAVIIPTKSKAQDAMTMDDCINYAVQNSYKTNIQKSRTDDDRIAYNQAIMNHMPSISAGAGLETNFGRGIDPATNSYINETSLGNAMNVTGNIPIFEGLQLINSSRKAKIGMLRGEKQLEKIKDDVAIETMIAYAEVVYNKELVGLYEQLVESNLLEKKKAERKAELGAGSKADLAQINAKLSQEKYALIKAKNNYEISIIKLKDCMNFPLDQELAIAQGVDQQLLYTPDQSTEEVINYAMSTNPNAIISQQNLKMEKLALSVARGGYYPTLSVYGGISSAFYRHLNDSAFDPYGTQLKNNLGEWVGLSLSVPIFNQNYKRNTVRRAKNNYTRAQLQNENDLRTLESEIRQAIMELAATESAWQEAQHNVEYQKLANEAIAKKYEKGVASILDLQTSDANLFRAELELRNSYLRYELKLREVNYYKGIPLHKN